MVVVGDNRGRRVRLQKATAGLSHGTHYVVSLRVEQLLSSLGTSRTLAMVLAVVASTCLCLHLACSVLWNPWGTEAFVLSKAPLSSSSTVYLRGQYPHLGNTNGKIGGGRSSSGNPSATASMSLRPTSGTVPLVTKVAFQVRHAGSALSRFINATSQITNGQFMKFAKKSSVSGAYRVTELAGWIHAPCSSEQTPLERLFAGILVTIHI